MQCSQLWLVSNEVADWQSYNEVVVFLDVLSSFLHLSKKSITLLLLIRILTSDAVLLRPTGDFPLPVSASAHVRSELPDFLFAEADLFKDAEVIRTQVA